MPAHSKNKTEKRFEVGEKIRVAREDGKISEGVIIDSNQYPGGRVLLIQFADCEKEIREDELRKNLSKRRC